MTNIELSLLYNDPDVRNCVRGQLLKTSGSALYPEIILGNLDVYTNRLVKIICADPAITGAASPFNEEGKLLSGMIPVIENAANYTLANPEKVSLISDVL